MFDANGTTSNVHRRPATATSPQIEIRQMPDHTNPEASVLQHPSGNGVLIITSAPEDESAHFVAG